MKFHSPYQFIPVTGRIGNGATPTAAYSEKGAPGAEEDIRDGSVPFVRHDRWEADACSGRILCRLEAISPLVVGGEQIPSTVRGSARVRPYRNRYGLAIPANSLRGMVANVAEAISQSAMRVLADASYSVRKSMRGGSLPGILFEAFQRGSGDNANILPWSRRRNGLTPAECLFGVVETLDEGEKNARNVAGRVRFRDARPMKEITLGGPKTLKILASPKPPCPAMYFRKTNAAGQPVGGYIRKEELNLATTHIPAGRKRYLPPRAADIAAEPWYTADKTDNAKQKLRVKPLPARSEFLFHIDFDNLSKTELGLLLIALDPRRYSSVVNGSKFVHRLGLGKPLGLGVVSVDILGVYFVDRANRYSLQGLTAPRYSHWWPGATVNGDCSLALAQHYPEETGCPSERRLDPDIDTTLVDPESLRTLVRIGDLDSLEGLVCYPFSGPDGQAAFEESEGFKWFVLNDDKIIKNNNCRQSLAPVTGQAIPTLDSEVAQHRLPQDALKRIALDACPSGRSREAIRKVIVSKVKVRVFDVQIDVGADGNRVSVWVPKDADERKVRQAFSDEA